MTPIIRECLAFHEAFRRLGFASDDIYLGIAGPPGDVQVGVLLKTQGLEFYCAVAIGGFAKAAVAADWNAATAWWNDPASSEAERRDIWQSSSAFRRSAEFVAALIAKGFVFPTKSTPVTGEELFG